MTIYCIIRRIFFFLLAAAVPYTAYAQDAGEIAFFQEHEGTIHILDTNTGALKTLDVKMSDVHRLAYNHEKRMLVFEGSKYHEGPIAIYAYDMKSEKIKTIHKPSLLSGGKDVLLRAEFEPGGRHLFALNYDTGIFRYSFEGKKWEKVRVSGTSETVFRDISISGSGKKAALTAEHFKGFFIGDLSGTEIRVSRRIPDDFDYCSSLRWAGDDVVLFLGMKKDEPQYLWRLSLVDGTLRQLTRLPLKARDFMDISSDGKAIVFTATDTDSDWRLWKINTDGTGLAPVTKFGRGHLSPVWVW